MLLMKKPEPEEAPAAQLEDRGHKNNGFANDDDLQYKRDSSKL